ncbi:protein tramtrack, beta isoform isoform X6 [Eurytemora carolleeae]|uniref:protein tramtrack, beta isoform isoform X6 n=1 Tax=Eurytemora carolleeae TaxID=1294199 RepID=UPI000C78D631|nr:protein tramtrack, beta isoform isoform X6 [Eurytemora carolleeae]|eukprot:XP_023321930.1 protein tramtrack, beta isoform-like isoform X6 [Eurytemora affinis]
MGNQDEQFCLKWNDFQQCIKSTFQDLREESDFMDVTLSCDGQQIKAHKVILSACSLTFKNLLKQNPSQNPVILLWDVSPRDLSSILDFMYNGEVNVKQEHLNSFLSVAEKLRVRGLCQNNGKDTNKPKDNKTKVRAAEPSETPAKRPKFDQIDDDEIEEIKPTEPPTVKQERLETVTPGFSAAVPPQSVQVVGEAFTEEFAETEDYGEYYEDGNYGVDPVDQGQAGKGYGFGEFKCSYCYKLFSREVELADHLVLHYSKMSCGICGKQFKNINTLRNHRSLYHKGEK